MANRYSKTYQFLATEEEAKKFCEDVNRSANAYCRKRYPAYYTPWESTDGKTKMFIAWFWW